MAPTLAPPTAEFADREGSVPLDSGSASDSSAALAPLLDARWALGWRHVGACAWFCFLFLYFNYIPLFHSDLWGHVHYGKWMLEQGQLVDEDPFMPLAQGMHAANNAWLSQVILAQMHAWGGPHVLSNLFAVVVVGGYLIHARTFYLLTGRLSFAVLGTVLLLAVGWSRHAIIRPEIFGYLMFAALAWLIVSGGDGALRSAGSSSGTETSSFGWRVWLGVPLLFAMWVNLHGSFAVGLVVVACITLATVLEEAWRIRSVEGTLRSPRVQRWAILTQLSFAACLINPYGLDMLLETWKFGKNPNLKDVLEWYPLKLVDMEGLSFGLSLVLLFAAARWSRRKIRPAEILLLAVFIAAMAPTIRMIAWYAPIFVLVWLPHAADAAERLFRRFSSLLRGTAGPSTSVETTSPAAGDSTPSARTASDDATTAKESWGLSFGGDRATFRFVGTLACGLMVWCTFAFSPISQPILGGKTRPLNRVYSRGTPQGITKYLREHPCEHLVFGPQWWGDWLAWDGPQPTRVFMTTHVHLAPATVWKDYLRVARGLTGWQQTLDRYAVGTLVVDKTLQVPLVDAVRGVEGWTIVYEDEQGLIAERAAAPKTPASEESSS